MLVTMRSGLLSCAETMRSRLLVTAMTSDAGTPFARYVAYTEEEFLIAQVEVVQVSSHGFGRLQHAVDVDVVAVGVGRVYLGYHRHLYLAGYVQFALYASFLLVDVLQFVYVFGQVALHAVQRTPQVVNLVAALHLGQFYVEVTLCYALCRACETEYGTQELPDEQEHEDAEYDDECGVHRELHDAYFRYAFCNLALVARQHNGPPHALDGCVVEYLPVVAVAFQFAAQGAAAPLVRLKIGEDGAVCFQHALVEHTLYALCHDE